MAKSKSKTTSKTQQRTEDDILLQALPFVRDTRGETFRKDQGLHWWHVSNTDYWHQDLAIGEAFLDKAAALHGKAPERVEQALQFALMHIVSRGHVGGIEQGFLNRLVHFAAVGMNASGCSLSAPVMTKTV